MTPVCVHCHGPIRGHSRFNDTPEGPVHFVCALAWRMGEPARRKAEAEREALRQEGRQQERAAIVEHLRIVAEQDYEGREERTLRAEAAWIEKGGPLRTKRCT